MHQSLSFENGFHLWNKAKKPLQEEAVNRWAVSLGEAGQRK